MNDPEALFRQGRMTPITESLNSITSQNDYNDLSNEQVLFTYETEKLIFSSASLKKNKKKNLKHKYSDVGHQ